MWRLAPESGEKRSIIAIAFFTNPLTLVLPPRHPTSTVRHAHSRLHSIQTAALAQFPWEKWPQESQADHYCKSMACHHKRHQDLLFKSIVLRSIIDLPGTRTLPCQTRARRKGRKSSRRKMCGWFGIAIYGCVRDGLASWFDDGVFKSVPTRDNGEFSPPDCRLETGVKVSDESAEQRGKYLGSCHCTMIKLTYTDPSLRGTRILLHNRSLKF